MDACRCRRPAHAATSGNHADTSQHRNPDRATQNAHAQTRRRPAGVLGHALTPHPRTLTLHTSPLSSRSAHDVGGRHACRHVCNRVQQLRHRPSGLAHTQRTASSQVPPTHVRVGPPARGEEGVIHEKYAEASASSPHRRDSSCNTQPVDPAGTRHAYARERLYPHPLFHSCIASRL